jgi:Subtilase family
MKRESKNKSSISPPKSNRASATAFRVTLAISCVIAFTLAFDSFPNRITKVNAAQAQADNISESALAQISSLLAAKASRTPVEQKIDSNILAAIKASRGEPIALNAPAVQPDVKIDPDGRLLVDIDANVTDQLLKQIEEAGGEVVNSFEQYNAIRARIPLAQAEGLAGSEDVKFINRAAEAKTRRARQSALSSRALPQSSSPSFAARVGRVRSQLPYSLAALTNKEKLSPGQFGPYIGIANSAGDVAHTAALARTTFGVNGSGVKIGVLSDSFNNLGGAAADVISGDLPGPGNPNGFTTAVTVIQDLPSGGEDEGRAMLQIVHDLAPGARLYYATAFLGSASFASNIQALRNNGCDIIIDDVGYADESPFQDAIIAQAVNTVTASGALYFSSAGNAGNLNDGTPGVWEGDFSDSGTDLVIDGNSAGRLHRFNATSLFNTMNLSGDPTSLALFWSDALGQSANDYDLFILNSAGNTVLRMSDNPQTGVQNPFEFIDTINNGEKIAIVKFSGSGRFIHLTNNDGRLSIGTSGQTAGHNCAVNAFNVAAVRASTAGGGAFVGGFTNPVETFSSDGLRRVFYNANGTAITPGNFSSTGGSVRQKPDIAAADGVATTLPPSTGLNPFFGTSAAAPHAGAVAALLKSFSPSLTAAQIRSILTSTALDIEAPGVDRDSGAGIVMAVRALQAAAPAAGGTDTIGLYRSGISTFYLRNTNTSGFPDIIVPFGNGPGGDLPIAGDWNGDGVWTIGVYRPTTSTFFLRNSNSSGFPDLSIPFGASGDKAVVGDWNGDGITTIGLYRSSGSIFYLRNSNTTGAPDLSIPFGASGDLPVVGDWNGDGTTTIGLYRPSGSIFYLRNSNTSGSPDLSVPFGASGDKPLAGNWDGL